MLKGKRTVFKGKKSIALRDVVVHMQAMERRLTKRADGTDARVDQLSTKIDSVEKNLTSKLNEVEAKRSNRIKALDEDLTATIKDTIRIRQHVGMPVALED